MPSSVPLQTQRDLQWALAITIAIFILEITGAQLSNSLSLLGDAFHVFSDIIGLSAAFLAFKLSQLAAGGRRTFGFHRTEVLAALLNGGLLVLIALGMVWRGYERLISPVSVDVPVVLGVGMLGLLANLYVASLLGRNENLNIKAAFFHVVGDALTSLAVILGSLLILVTGNFMFDAIVSFLIAAIILTSAYHLIRNALSILLESAPRFAHPEKIAAVLCKTKGVREIHDLHVWSVCSDIVHLTAHVVVEDKKVSDTTKLNEWITALLEKQFKIAHSTLQFESVPCTCAKEGKCEIY